MYNLFTTVSALKSGPFPDEIILLAVDFPEARSGDANFFHYKFESKISINFSSISGLTLFHK